MHVYLVLLLLLIELSICESYIGIKIQPQKVLISKRNVKSLNMIPTLVTSLSGASSSLLSMQPANLLLTEELVCEMKLMIRLHV